MYNIVNAVTNTGIKYGTDFANQVFLDNTAKYQEAYMRYIDDGVIDPGEKMLLEDLQEELGLTDEEVKETVGNYLETFAIEKPSEAELVNASRLTDFFNEHKFMFAEEFSETSFKHRIPALPDMTEEAAKALLEVLDSSEYNLWADFENGNFWLEDRQESYDKFLERNLSTVIAKAWGYANEWANDETVGEPRAWERKCLELLEGFYPEDYLIPVDVNYRFLLPTEILMKDGGYDEIGRKPIDICDSAIRHKFLTESDIIKDKCEIRENGTLEDLTYRHYFAVSHDTDYSNIPYSEIEAKLQFEIGRAINEALGVEQKVLFESITASRPENISFKYDRQQTTVSVSNEAIEKFRQTPEQYSLSLDLENLKNDGITVKEAVGKYIKERELFMAALEEIPSLKDYVLEKWNGENLRNFDAANRIDLIANADEKKFIEQDIGILSDVHANEKGEMDIPGWESVYGEVISAYSRFQLSVGERKNLKSVIQDVCNAIEGEDSSVTLSVGGNICSTEKDPGCIRDYLVENLFNRQWNSAIPLVTSIDDSGELLEIICKKLEDVYKIDFPNMEERFYLQPDTNSSFKTLTNVPKWAAGYMATGEAADLTDEETAQVDAFMKSNNIHSVIQISESSYFSSHPEFGLASDCVDINVSIKGKVIEHDSKDVSSGMTQEEQKGYDEWNEMLSDNDIAEKKLSEHREPKTESQIISEYISKIKEKLSDSDRKVVENVLSAAKKSLEGFSEDDKKIIGQYLFDKGAKSESSLGTVLKKEVNPPEHKIERKRSVNYERGR